MLINFLYLITSREIWNQVQNFLSRVAGNPGYSGKFWFWFVFVFVFVWLFCINTISDIERLKIRRRRYFLFSRHKSKRNRK